MLEVIDGLLLKHQARQMLDRTTPKAVKEKAPAKRASAGKRGSG